MRNALVAVLTLAALATGVVLLRATPEVVEPGPAEVHIYVSLDQEHSAQLLADFEEDFEKETGERIEVVATYDTEATKTIGLRNRLIGEKDDPQADVYWNNELATTITLKEHGVLQRYVSRSAQDIPAAFKDPDGFWTGFAARARVLIVNTDLVGPDERPTSMWDLADPKWKGKTCMARPETGTTAAHASALYVLDEARADEYFDKLISNDVTWLTGNAHCMREVSAGRFHFGWTDTDDFNVARLKGAPVAMVYPDAAPDAVGVMYIPNSLALIKGARHAGEGRKLIDWLLRAAVEKRLAHSATAQIPVRPGVDVPDHVRRPDQIGTVMELDWDRVGKEYDGWVAHVRAKLGSAETSSPTLTWIIAAVVVVAVAGGLLLKKMTGEPA